MSAKFAIAIPARYGSTRFPGKPLAEIAGKTMIARVLEIAKKAAEPYDDVSIFVASDDKHIADHVRNDLGAACINTPTSCKTGSDRVLSALRQLSEWPDFIVNLQGDVPFTPPHVIQKLFDRFLKDPKAEVITPVHRLSWEGVDALRESKKITPFSGTTTVINENGDALWFSKTILPAMRNENDLRESSPLSPVYRHLGIYGFRTDILETFCSLPEGVYEKIEGLEQLRLLENNIRISAVEIEMDKVVLQSGIDSPEDITRAEAYIARHGEII